MKALIIAGGPGTRLRPLISDRPKPMAEVQGRPFLEYQMEQLSSQGFNDVVLCIGYMSNLVQDYFGDGHRLGMCITYAVETELLGTGGAIGNARGFIKDTFLALNGDSYLEINFQSLVEFHKRMRVDDPLSVGTIATVKLEEASNFGTLDLEAANHSMCRINRFQEKTCTGAGWINAGIYILETDILDLIPTDRVVSLERETFPMALEHGFHLYAYPVKSFFVDIGIPKDYLAFCRYVENAEL